MTTIETYKATIYYEMHGAGPTVVLAHGGGSNTLCWYQQVPEFSKRYRVLLFDHRGFGRSACDVDDIHPRYFADDLISILDQEGIDRVAIAGHALGGWTALAAAMSAPERVSCIALSATAGGILTDDLIGVFKTGPGRAVGTRDIVKSIAAPEFTANNPDLMFLLDQIGALNQDVGAAMVRLLDPANGVTREQLVGYSVPTLVLAGGDSQIIPPEVLREAASLIPGAEIHVLPGVGHAHNFKAPETYNQMVGEFLGRHVK